MIYYFLLDVLISAVLPQNFALRLAFRLFPLILLYMFFSVNITLPLEAREIFEF